MMNCRKTTLRWVVWYTLARLAVSKRSIVHRYCQFSSSRSRYGPGSRGPLTPRTQEGAGNVLEINEHHGTIDIKRRGTSSPVPHPTAVIPYNIVKSTALRDSLLRLATDIANHGFDAMRADFQAAKGSPPS